MSRKTGGAAFLTLGVDAVGCDQTGVLWTVAAPPPPRRRCVLTSHVDKDIRVDEILTLTSLFRGLSYLCQLADDDMSLQSAPLSTFVRVLVLVFEPPSR